MSKIDKLKEIFQKANSLDSIISLFQELKFPVQKEENSLIVEMDENGFLEVFFFRIDQKLLNGLVSTFIKESEY
ncbi:hypothetical protein LEP1GSC158_3573 [Leptospira interrogans serovar Zanoni str. LT2156]|uniref:Uncharacterized protein n=1 Tax=Leptospira interrogans serovar Zanoni str. LT2156 TaxID=1001601 RepID=M6HQT8_LEPIR|nr:hypothetical protein LEP1GSC158_3573 [Leptospira interrogans serovar Zanoni str. LT2156]